MSSPATPPRVPVRADKPKRQFIQIADQQLVPLPRGVSVVDWQLEKANWQNPRIRAFLGCIRMLGSVLESNYAILHCSPERLLEIWRKVTRVTELIRNNIAPLLKQDSCIPKLNDAVDTARMSLSMLEHEVLRQLDGYPAEQIPVNSVMQVRKLLCVSIGQLHSFLQDTFGHIIANDPRSLHDADYFLSKRFPQDIDEAEWLHSTVVRLYDYMETVEGVRERALENMIEELLRGQRLLEDSTWDEATTFLTLLMQDLTSKIKGILALRGIRFYEMEILDRYADEIPTKCTTILELHRTGKASVHEIRDTVGTSSDERSMALRLEKAVQLRISRRIADLMSEVNKNLRDLIAFLPLWMEGIEKRRALILKRHGHEDDMPPTQLTEAESLDESSPV